jgi:hypothetical protein
VLLEKVRDLDEGRFAFEAVRTEQANAVIAAVELQ